MTNRYETLDHYLSVCKLHKKEESKLITKVLEKYTDIEPKVRLEKSDLSSSLNLRGNNYFLNNIKLNNDDAFCLYHALRLNSWVSILDLRYNRINDEGAVWIAKLIAENSTLKHLNLMCNDIGPDGAEQIALALQKNENIIYLNLNGNKIGNKGGMCMAQMLQVNVNLQHLDIGETDLKIESLIALATILNYNRTLKSLNVSRPVPQYQFANWMDEIAQHFAKMLKVNKTLKQLIMQKYELRDYGMHWISDKLLSNPHLVHLDLSCNRITRDGAKDISILLNRNTPLKVLDLGYNRLEDDGAKLLAEALSYANTNLQKLSIKSNNIGAEGLCALAECLNHNTSLTHVYIWGNNLEEPACIAFKKLIEKNKLKQENTDVRPYVVDGKTYLSELTNDIDMFYYWQPVYGDGVLSTLREIA
ncbi:unnamed protein product [Brachionus calyciflorus]|uniref:Leucine-rich repeat-containing protein 34 n=1 Tax=Brachionus calyciflorus TaxID=104777 RepID=A0A814GDD9_9BILA|nr:unnamed protein product [Brachionus calyciflorus]